MKNFKKFIAIFALIVTLGMSASLLFACGDKENVEKLSVYQEFKTEYYVGDTLDVSNGILKYINKENKEQYIPLITLMVGSFSTDLPGTRKMVITYEEETMLVEYKVNPYDVKDGIYYIVDSGSAQDSGAYKYTYLIFDLEQNTLTEIYSNGTPLEAIPGGMCFDIQRTETEQHFIEYTAVLKDAPVPATVKITDIGKNSFKFEATTGAVARICYEYVQQ